MLVGCLILEEYLLVSGGSLCVHNVIVEGNRLVLIYATYGPSGGPAAPDLRI